MSNKSKKLKLKIKGKDSESRRKFDEIISFLKKCGIIRIEQKYYREEITMNTETYILTKLKNLSEEDELLAQEIEKRLGPWSTPLDVSKYFKRHITTIYDMIDNNEIYGKKMKGRIRILSRSLVLAFEKK